MVMGNENNNKKSPWEDDAVDVSPKRNTSQPNFDDFFNKGHSSFNDAFKKFKNNKETGNSKLFSILLVVMFGLWLATGFYVVDEGEEALVIRFGKYQRTATTGLNYHIPSPIETAIKEKVDILRKEDVGFRSSSSTRIGALDSSNNVPQESLMLTGDENIVDINFIVQWKITNLKNFVFNVYNTRETVRSVAESAMREVIGVTTIDKAITDGRSSVEMEAKNLSQGLLNMYKSGVEITSLKLLRAEPPVEVIDAFRDVQTAKTDKEREINRALAFVNEIIPRARGEASKVSLESEAYRAEVVENAQGEVGRFNLVYDQYRRAKEITKKRLYLESMEQILQGVDKIIVDNNKNSPGVLPYLPLNQLENKSR